MSHKLREEVNEYSGLWMIARALEAAPTLSMFTQSAQFTIAGIAQSALITAQEEGKPPALKPHLDEISNAWFLVRQSFRANAGLSMLNGEALDGLATIVTDALYEKVDE